MFLLEPRVNTDERGLGGDSGQWIDLFATGKRLSFNERKHDGEDEKNWPPVVYGDEHECVGPV